jgi:STE24 endopeptidase
VVSVFELLGLPLGATLSRHWEREADRFSLELTRDPKAFELAHRRLATANLSDLEPPRAVYALLFSHPTPPERISAARAWARLHLRDPRSEPKSGGDTPPLKSGS